MSTQTVRPAGDEMRDRAIRLFRYLSELSELRTHTIRTLDEFEEVIWLSDIPRENGCYCIAWPSNRDTDETETWVQIDKPKLTSPPTPPKVLADWIDITQLEDSSIPNPQLKQRIAIEELSEPDDKGHRNSKTVFKDLSQFPHLRQTWENYVKIDWQAWAERDKGLQKVQKIYASLFSLYQKQQRLGEAFEVVLGIGFLTWRTPSNQDVSRHLITAQTALTFDAAVGSLSVGPAGEGAKLALEQDMLEPQERPDAGIQISILKSLAELEDDIWDPTGIQAVMKSWVNGVSPRSEVLDGLVPQTQLGPNPKVCFAPALILRRRTEKSFIRVFHEIIEQLEQGGQIPEGILRLLSTKDDDAATTQINDSHAGTLHSPEEHNELYFPLPANEEQQRIARLLATQKGIIVQGPPGTGKSHTIANLICHLLATGKRVLVTSHTARALKVLRDKLPKEISDLCVNLLGDDLKGMHSLEDSVGGISGRFNNWDAVANKRAVTSLESELQTLRKQEASLLSDLRELREAETYRHPPRFGDYEGTAKQIAARLKKEEQQYSWLPGWPEEDLEPPLSNQQALELLALLRKVTIAEEQRLAGLTITSEQTLNPAVFGALIEKEAEAKKLVESTTEHRSHRAFHAASKATKDQIKLAHDSISSFCSTASTLLNHPESWVRRATFDVLQGKSRVWEDQLRITLEHLSQLGDSAQEVWERKISGISERDRSVVKADATSLLEHLASGGGFGFGPFKAKIVKQTLYLKDKVKVNGKSCDSTLALNQLIEWIDFGDRLDALRKYWSQCTVPEGSFPVQISYYKDLCDILVRLLKLRDHLQRTRTVLLQIPNIPEPTWHEIDSLLLLLRVFDAVPLVNQLSETGKAFQTAESNLREALGKGINHPVAMRLVQSIRERNEKAYAAAHGELSYLDKLRSDVERREVLLTSLQVDAPALANQLQKTAAELNWDTRLTDFVAAWNWNRAEFWLQRFTDPKRSQRSVEDLENCRKQIREKIKLIASEKAWGHCFGKLSDHERGHLVAWSKAVKRIGKGTGKHANTHRQEARKHMDECRPAIPAWIMPVYRVAETLKPGTDSFDIIVVDESSQSGPEALFLQYLAPQIIVVGDDQQISPDNVGLDRNNVNLLRQRHIPDFPHGDSLGPDSSFFTHSEIRFGSRIRLREHFRCMPEIIQFSNNLCYKSEPLIPLRQFGLNRLQPVIVTRYIRDGYMQGEHRTVNPPEAEAVVSQIIGCSKDPNYKDKSFGVISLQGEFQARLIETLLLEQLGPEEMERRHIVCGDAYAFQGDERDVMFLSMVAAPTEGRRIGTLSNQKDERRFNVAASRARDQMMLFHSVTLNDLSPSCLRYRLLEYCLQPHVESDVTKPGKFDLSKIDRKEGESEDRNPPPPFDSWFEVDVYHRIVDKQYRVIPQMNFAGYWIDLVVEGMEGRLAVECDGDTWHGPERYQEDMARQRVLERCGWRFWRIRSSTFYRDPEGAMKDLWRILASLRIHPGGSDPHVAQVSVPRPVPVTTISPTPAITQTPDQGPNWKPEFWIQLSNWGRSTRKFNAFSSKFCAEVARLLSEGKDLTNRQRIDAENLWEHARRMGYRPGAGV